MSLFTHGHIKMAVTAVRANRWRSFLTMLGVIIGVASVITVVAISQGVKQQVSGQVSKLGKDLITVRASQVSSSGASGIDLLSSFTVLGSLPSKDYGTVATTKGVKTAVPLSIISGQIRGDNRVDNPIVIGTTSDLPGLLNQDLAYGVFFPSDEDNGGNVAVLGSRAAERIFSENVPLGRSFSYRGQKFVVRGIFDDFQAAPLSGEADFNDAVFIPYGTSQALSGNSASLYEVLAKPTDPKQADQVARSVEGRLLTNHGGAHDFSVGLATQTQAAANTILDLLTRLIAGVAAISLLVGGIGIMNVMLVSVTERMHEVGIRKAVGATNRQILNQFIIEATVLTIAGGFIGIVVAVLIDLLLRIFSDLQPAITWQIVVLAFFVSVAVGVIFGSVPAIKAARKQPIDALRNE